MRNGLIALVVALTACASASAPPGGPEDKAPPKLVRVTPDTNAVNVHDENVSFQFDETINDRGTGEQELDNFFLVSPSDGRPRVYWHRSRIDVRPRKGYRPNTAYTVTLLPGLGDLRSNKMKEGATLVFSTGPTIPREKITGIAFDWVAEKPAARAYMEAITPDSTIYLAQSDSLGRFTIGPLAPGSYLVRSIIDANNNRALDRNELYDTLRVTVPQSAPAELLAAVRDTLPARILTVAATDSLKLTVTFDRLLDPRQVIPATAFRLVAADSSPVPIVAVYSPRQEKVADSVGAKARVDSLRRVDSLAGKPLTPVAAPPAPVAQPTRTGTAPPPPPPKPSQTPPFTVMTVRLGQPLAPSKGYRLSVGVVRALSGRADSSARSFTTPKPPPPPKPSAKDSTARDSAAARTGAPLTAPRTPPVAPPRTPPARR